MSTLNVSNISDGTDTVETGYVVNGSAKAWVNYHMTSNAIGDSLNCSSVTDNGTGNFTLAFTTHMANLYYIAASSNAYTSSGLSQNYSSGANSYATSGIGYSRETSSGGANDQASYGNGLSVIGDLA